MLTFVGKRREVGEKREHGERKGRKELRIMEKIGNKVSRGGRKKTEVMGR